jgi:hypothetical protein
MLATRGTSTCLAWTLATGPAPQGPRRRVRPRRWPRAARRSGAWSRDSGDQKRTKSAGLVRTRVDALRGRFSEGNRGDRHFSERAGLPPTRLRFPQPPSREAQQSEWVAGFCFVLVFPTADRPALVSERASSAVSSPYSGTGPGGVHENEPQLRGVVAVAVASAGRGGGASHCREHRAPGVAAVLITQPVVPERAVERG